MSTEHDEGQPQMDSRERQVTLTFNSTRLIPLIDSLRKPILTLRSERLKIGMDRGYAEIRQKLGHSFCKILN
ncbi:hypothetical protein SAMN05216605_12129 [Pseudomonas abietaniphila]|uniref:Uncharacterized protein n=1 Tax=Pseudomonas abietaniphila TaxID=89065 RepID=A0A1G8QQE0_9PSED|nr:hypothetical protein SAMN05216605_12129 [Pseudomonas abietaniphila]